MKGKGGNGGECSTTRLVSSRMLVPPPPPPSRCSPISARGDFSFFGIRPSLCLFQYALLTLHRSLATGHEAPLFNLTFLILFLLLSRNRLMREQLKQPFEKERATICRRLSALLRSCLLFTSHRLLIVFGTIPRFVLADLPHDPPEIVLVLYGEEGISENVCRTRFKIMNFTGELMCS